MDTINLMDSLAGANSFFLHFISAVTLTFIFAQCYLWITPYAEFKLIRAGKVAPAVAFSAAILGFVLVLVGAVVNSVSLTDMLVWSLVGLLVQLGVFFGIRVIFTDLCERIADDELGPAIVLAGISMAAGLLNAACMAY